MFVAFVSLLVGFIFTFVCLTFAFVALCSLFLCFFPRSVQRILLTGKSVHKCRSGTRKRMQKKQNNNNAKKNAKIKRKTCENKAKTQREK